MADCTGLENQNAAKHRGFESHSLRSFCDFHLSRIALMEEKQKGVISTGQKTYLSQQINLMSVTTTDLFTPEEYDLYCKILNCITSANREDEKEDCDPSVKEQIRAEKSTLQERLSSMILSRTEPREVRLLSVLDKSKLERDSENHIIVPKGVSWKNLSLSKKIAEFASDESRAMGLKNGEVTFDKIIVKWKSLDILEQVVKQGFYMSILTDDGTVIRKHYRFATASAGQLRTDKIQMLSDEAWNKICGHLFCGLSFEKINEKGGINANKLMAYIALGASATDPWPELDIDRVIVVDDVESPVTGLVDYINPNYSIERGIRTTEIKHTDGCGMMLPSVSRKNFMIRAPWIKGLLSSFDFIRFCKVHHAPPIIKDVYGTYHNLEKENIQVILTKSQFKLWNFYDSWDDYKQKFKENNCCFNRTNFEEDYVPDTDISYQMLQTLTDFSNEELSLFTLKSHDKITGIAKSSESMLQTLQADKESVNSYKRALAVYPELLREAYSKETLKSIKKKWTLDAKSGRIKCSNKRLFVVPDFYAMCEYWFLHIKAPKGLLQDGEVACRPFRNTDKIAALRSPHLYMEWTIRKVLHEQNIYDWFYTDAIYTSCHDLISKVLQFDCDGDQLNCVSDSLLISIAERNIKKYNIVPLLYELGKAGAKPININEFFEGLKRAHNFSGIGQVSNSLTKLWNRDNPDREAAAILCFYNNLVIDAAKTGFVNGYDQYPAILKRINKATGGKNGKMPFFFQFSKNGRRFSKLPVKERKKYAKINQSTMNQLCACFDNIGNINFNYANVAPFNWQMFLVEDTHSYYSDAVELFCRIDDSNIPTVIQNPASDSDIHNVAMTYDFTAQEIIDELTSKYGSLEEVYPSIVKFLFVGSNASKIAHKRMFWRVFGNIACSNLESNLETYSICPKCGMKIPAWSKGHICPKKASGFFECCDCGAWCGRTNSKQCRCSSCQDKAKKLQNSLINKMKYQRKKLLPSA